MILFNLLTALFIIITVLLIPLILVQKGKGSMGLGTMGGGAQMIFGGSGGQDLFQKITWIFGAIFMFGSLALSLMKTQEYRSARYLNSYKQTTQIPQQ
ncbi:MAG: preprotein translocase subunit SecG [Candidatus Babeliales bacterium]